VPDYANVLVKVVGILGVIYRVPPAIPEHNVFCYSAVAHILTPSVNLAFGSKSGFKNKCWARAGFGLQNEALLQLCVGTYAESKQGEIERIHPPPTNSKYRLKWFCEVGYANFRPNVFGVGKRISVEILVGVGATCVMPSSIKKIRSFFEKRKCSRKIFIVFATLSDLNKTSNRAVTHTSYEMHESWSVLL